MTRPLLVLMALGVLLIGAAPAHADYAGERAAVDPLLTREVQLAVGFWADRGVTGCPEGVGMSWADSLADTDLAMAGGRGEDCHVWLDVTYFRLLRPGPRTSDGDIRDDAVIECGVVVHEVGHALGIVGHTPTGVMSAQTDVEEAPWACRVFVRRRLSRAAARRTRRNTASLIRRQHRTRRPSSRS